MILSWPRPFAVSTPGLTATVQLRGAVDKNHHLPLEGTAAAWLKAADRAVTGKRTQEWPVREEGGDGDSIEEPQGPRSTVPSSCPGSTPRTLPEQERRVAQPKGMGGVTAVWESGTPGSEPRRCTHASREVLSTRFPLFYSSVSSSGNASGNISFIHLTHAHTWSPPIRLDQSQGSARFR